MLIVENRKARHEYTLEATFEAGLVLEGWEVKAIRARRVQIQDAYVLVRRGELFVIGMHVSALASASTHVHPDPTRTRKLLMHRREIDRLIGKVERAGYALVPLDLHLSNRRIKMTLALARGKKLHDKRASEKERDWQREKARLMRTWR